MKRILAVALALVSFSASAADLFPFDRALATDLAKAYVHAHIRARPDHFPAPINFKSLKIIAAIDKLGRHLVLVSFGALTGTSGAYVALQVCPENDLLVAAESGAADDIDSFRRQARQIDASTWTTYYEACNAPQDP